VKKERSFFSLFSHWAGPPGINASFYALNYCMTVGGDDGSYPSSCNAQKREKKKKATAQAFLSAAQIKQAIAEKKMTFN